jgi:hypothetical protein
MPAQMYTLGSYETNAPHMSFFHKDSTDVAPLRFKSAMCLSNLFLYKATFTVNVLETNMSASAHRLNMELDLQSLFGLLRTAVLIGCKSPQLPPPPPMFGLKYEGAIGQPR